MPVHFLKHWLIFFKCHILSCHSPAQNLFIFLFIWIWWSPFSAPTQTMHHCVKNPIQSLTSHSGLQRSFVSSRLNISGRLIKPFQGLFLFLSPVLLCLRKFSVTVCSDSCLPLYFTHLTYSLWLICWKWVLVFYPARFLTPMYQHIHTHTHTVNYIWLMVDAHCSL